MKLATYHDGSRDGQLIVVSRDLASAHYATGIATRLQQVLDDWNFLAPQLEALSLQLNQGRLRHAFDFDAKRCMAPLPRAFHWREWLHGGPGHTALGERALAAHARVATPGPAWLQPGLAAITGDVAASLDGRDAIEAVRLLMWVAHGRTAGADAEPAAWCACAPVALTPDELGAAWRGGRLQPGADGEAPLQAQVRVEGRRVAVRENNLPKRWPQEAHVGELIAEAAATGRLGAGAVMAWSPAVDETQPPLDAVQRWRAELLDAEGQSVFGAIELTWGVEAQAPAPAETAPAVQE